MFKNYFITALRFIRRERLSSVINIGGLAIGMASFILIFLYIRHEVSYDRHWQDLDRIYRISESIDYGERAADYASSPYALGPSLKSYFPAVEAFTRITASQSQTPVRVGKEVFNMDHVHFADSNFFKIFRYRFVEGSRDALKEPNNIVISREAGRKLFGEKSLMGREVTINKRSFKVAGVIDHSQEQSHLEPNIIRSTTLFGENYLQKIEGDWTYMMFYTYLKLDDVASLAEIKDGLPRWHLSTIKPWLENHELTYKLDFKLEPLSKIHFLTQYDYDVQTNTDVRYLHIFGYVAAFILLIVVINYINLATARAANRANEVGIRKTMGAQKKDLIRQFLGESLLTSLLALFFGILLVELLLPLFNGLLEKNLSLTKHLFSASGAGNLLVIVAVMLLVGLISGIFPAFILSRFRALHIAGKDFWYIRSGKGSGYSFNLRRGLVVFQFIVTTSMIIATLIVFHQMHYMRSQDLGFDKERVVVIDVPEDRDVRQQTDAIRSEMARLPGVSATSASDDFPGFSQGRVTFYIEKEDGYRQEMINYYRVDEQFADLLDIEITEGRFFSGEFPSDPTSAFVINEAARKILGEDPIGRRMVCGLGVNGKIVGVTENFNYSSLHNPIEPLVYMCNDDNSNYLALKIGGENISSTLEDIEQTWKRFDPQNPYIYSFLDQQFDSQYNREEKMLSIFGYFSVLTILLACLGLFGLSAFMAQRRRKEIGIRKVMGSDAGRIVRSFLKDYVKWVVLANIISWPLIYYLMSQWLQDFAYRTSLDWLLFMGATILTLILAMSTVGYHAMKAANTNPAEVLRDE